MAEIMSGNEAVARGIYEAGCTVAAAYPGTPSTEILENLATKYKDKIYSQWACNEKVAVEIALGASIGGVRAFSAMKHGGMNVATDPIFTAGYIMINRMFVALKAQKVATVLSILRNFVFRLGTTFLLPRLFGPNGIWFCFPVSEALGFSCSAAAVIRNADNYGYGKSGVAYLINTNNSEEK